MTDLDKTRGSPVISGRLKVPKPEVEDPESFGDDVDGVEFEQVTTDEFDIPPTYIFRATVNLKDIRKE